MGSLSVAGCVFSSLPLIWSVKEFGKLVNIWWSYQSIKVRGLHFCGPPPLSTTLTWRRNKLY